MHGGTEEGKEETTDGRMDGGKGGHGGRNGLTD